MLSVRIACTGIPAGQATGLAECLAGLTTQLANCSFWASEDSPAHCMRGLLAELPRTSLTLPSAQLATCLPTAQWVRNIGGYNYGKSGCEWRRKVSVLFATTPFRGVECHTHQADFLIVIDTSFATTNQSCIQTTSSKRTRLFS